MNKVFKEQVGITGKPFPTFLRMSKILNKPIFICNILERFIKRIWNYRFEISFSLTCGKFLKIKKKIFFVNLKMGEASVA